MEKYDTSQLTEFPRFESESSQSSVSTFFNKFLKFPLFTPSEGSDNGNSKSSGDDKQDASRPENQGKEEYDDGKTETGTYAVELEGRSLPNVLRRISSLVAMGSGGGTRYADTELARYWMPDDISRECYECATRFSTLRRRHHCRVCGQIFCSRCCSQRVPGHIFGCNGGLRVCNYCCNVVLSYLKENDLTGEISPDLRTLQENLQVKFPDNKDQSSKTRDNFVFAHDQEERCEIRSSPKETLQDVFRQLSFGLPTQQHRYRLVSYNGVWRGCDVLQWIMDNTHSKTRIQASMICQNLLSSGYMECVTELPHFADYALYRPVAVIRDDDDEDDDDGQTEDRGRLVESVSSYCLDLNLGNKSARLIKTPKAEKKSSSSEEEGPVIEQNEGYVETKHVCRAISQLGADHLRLLLRQCLARAALPPAWLDTLLPLCVHAADSVTPDPSSDDIDVRNYVQVKKVAGGAARDSCLVHGVVLTKNVAHRGMPQQISNPSILLLDCSIAYQRVEGKLTSLEPVLMQENEYLTRCAARITALRPKVVLVSGGAGRTVQAALRRAGAALALRVPTRALQRLARCAKADVLTSIDARIGLPRLGTCKNFYVKNYESKTLMVLEGCSEPQLGCCVLLRGSMQELVRVKKVVRFMLLACYNWKLEKAFLGDIEAILPEPGTTFDDEIDDNNEGDNASIDSAVKMDDAEVYEELKIQKDISNDIFKNESIKSNESNSDVFEMDGEKTENGTKETIEIANNENSQVTKDENRVSNTENTPLNAKHTEDASENIQKPCTENAQNSSIENFQETSKENIPNFSVENNLCTKITENTCEVNLNTNNATDAANMDTDDPLQRPKFTRKTENLSCGVPIRDFSDPLRATLSVDDDVFLPKEEATLKADAQTERWSADDVVLSMSPNVLIPAPYLETEAGRRCPFRGCFPTPLLPTPRHHTPRHNTRARSSTDRAPITTHREYHPFVTMAIRTGADDLALKAELASFRATGGRTNKNNHKPSCPQYNPSVVRSERTDAVQQNSQAKPEDPVDPFSPEQHQQLHVLLYSYSTKSPNVPDFCVNPWIAVMEMYGRHDISLGAFLHKYCFNPEYKCTSATCHVPMNQHVRKFVHGDVCITITCNTIGHSNVDKLREEQTRQVMFWSRCEQCGATGRARRLSPAALALSLAQYVRWRVSAARCVRGAACAHAQHRAHHAFQCNLTTACFRYSKISTYDIILPPDMITTNYDTKQMRDTLISQLNELMQRGHETFNNIGSGEADKEYQTFKLHMENIHVALTAPALHDPDTDAVVQSLWTVSDGIISGEKMLRDAQDKWSIPPAKPAAKQPTETPVEDKSDIDESSGEAGGNDNTGTTYVFSDNNSKDSDKEHTGTEEDEEKGDKKTVRQILSQLLSNNQPANDAGIVLCGGLVPVVVRATQTGSVIAAALASATYRRARKQHNTQSESEEADSNAASKEKADGDKSKAAKSNEHVEVLLKDGLVCRVYYAAQFQALRHAVIAPRGNNYECCCDNDKKLCNIEEGFIRSLAQCVPWAARGGKSGSTFCKTKDDRYVLKEMTKPEWQQFLEFAPHYFNYVASCRQNRVPSLLARILGVYSVGGAGSGVLVMENVWYSAPEAHTRFDLKGSSRHRLASAEAPRAVLMDENLLNLRWERALYVRGACGRALRACVSRDAAFLASHGVMDYSLLLALGDSTLVLGVIDYIRTFTWDKKLEHLVKKNLGSGQPTVVSPEQYMKRFCAAARKYFLQCPEHWDHLYNVLPSMLGQ